MEATGPPDVVLPSGVLAPGLIDLQVNGCFGVEFAYDEDWSPAVARLPETGVTAFLPTFITAPMEVLVDGLRRVPDVAAGRPDPRRARRGAVPGRRAEGRPRRVAVPRPRAGAARRAARARHDGPAHPGAGAGGRAGGDRAAGRRGRAGERRPQRRAGRGGGRRRHGRRADGHAPVQRDARDPPPRAGRRRAGAGRRAARVRADPRRSSRGRDGRPGGVRGGGRADRSGHATRSPPPGCSPACTSSAASR